jgi:hypothetical protein
MRTKYEVSLTGNTVDTVLADDYKTEDGMIKFYRYDTKYSYSGDYNGYIPVFIGNSYNTQSVVKIINKGME